MAEEVTYLEEFLLSLETLPNNFRRECELLKELDREVMEANRELCELENAFLTNLAQATASAANEKLKADMDALRDRASVKLAEKAAIVNNLIIVMDQFSNKLDMDLGKLEAELKNAGEYEAPPGLPLDTEVAFRTEGGELVMGQVLQYRSEISCYDILDVDDKRKYTVLEAQVHPLGQVDITTKKLCKGDHVFALFPDTTAFYPATVIQAPRRNALNAEATVILQFDNDEDPATGLALHRTAPLKYIVRIPAP